MKISELINKIETEGYSVCDSVTNTFLTTDEMYAMIDDLKERAIVLNDAGMFEVDVLLRDITINLALLDVCTDIEFDEQFTFEQYDLLRKHKVFQTIIKRCEELGDDLQPLFKLCNESLVQEIKVKTSIEGIIANGIMNLVDKIPNNEEMMSYIKEFKGFNPETMGLVKNLFEFANKGSEEKKGDKNE